MPITPKPLPDLNPRPADLSGFPPITGDEIGPWTDPGELWLDHATMVAASSDPAMVAACAALARDVVTAYGVPPWAIGIGSPPRRTLISRAARAVRRWWLR